MAKVLTVSQSLFDTLRVWRFDIAIVLGALLLAMFFGLIASTGQPLLIAVAAGLFFGVYALSNPSLTIWLVLTAGLFVAGLVPIWAAGIASKAVWGISLLGLAVLGSALFKVLGQIQSAKHSPLFVWLALIFLFYALFNGVVQSSFYELASGFKRYFQVIGLCFAFAWLGFPKRKFDYWFKLCAVLLVVQLPFAIYERLTLVPLREGIKYAYPGMIPIDVVAGTFGASKYGGGANGEMATFLILGLAFVLAKRREQLLSQAQAWFLMFFAITPLFLGETKIVMVFLPLMFITLYKQDLLAKPIFMLGALVMGSALTLAVTYTYLQLVEAATVGEMISNTLDYNFRDKGHGGLYLNRVTSLVFWFNQQGLGDPTGFLFGHGIGTAHDSTGGSLAVKYAGYGIGLTALAALLWEQGVVGVALFYGILVSAWMTAGRLRKSRNSRFRADAAAIQCGLSLLLVYPLYRATLLEGLPFQIVFWSLLGYLAWMYRSERLQPQPS